MSSMVRLGLFVLGGFLILLAGVFLIGNNQSLFSSTYRVRAQFKNVAGLNDGAQVRVGGIASGTVERVELPQRPTDSITVVMNLKKDTRSLVKKDSVASIQSEGLLGDMYVEVSFGSADGAPLKNGDTIESRPPFEISQVMEKADRILNTAGEAMNTLNATAGNVESITAKINQGKGTIGALVNDKSVYKEAEAGVTGLHEDAEALKHNFLLRGFFKNRGYEDKSELTQHQISEVPKEPPVKSFRYEPKDLFDKPDSSKLKKGKDLDDAGKFLEDQQFGLVVVAASSTANGDRSKIQQLTEAQAAVVREYLVNKFRVDDTRIKTVGLGKTEPQGDTDARAAEFLEILVYPPQVAAPPKNVPDRKR